MTINTNTAEIHDFTKVQTKQAPSWVDHETASHKADEHQRLWLRLLSLVNLVEGEIRGNLRTEFKVTLPRFEYMSALDKAETPLTMGDLSKRLMVTGGNVTGLTDRLVSEGLVKRTRSEQDRRTQFVELTEEGRQSFSEMALRHAEWIEQAFADLNTDERGTLMALLGKMKFSVRNNLMASEGVQMEATA